MSAQVTNYQCPNCTGPLHFDGESGKLKCEYCGSGYSVEEIETLYKEKEEKAAAAQQREEKEIEERKNELSEDNTWDKSDIQQWGTESEDMQAYSCPSCGAELICEKTTVATSCPYCGNPTVVPGKFSGNLKPDFIIPFKIGKEEAIKTLKNHYKGKIFLPKRFTEENHVQEIKGIYVPFWMFDGMVEGHATYEATRTRVYNSGDYKITETEHYDVYREGSVDFEKVPVDASSKMPDEYMDSIEPFNYKELKNFSTAYLPGFLADKFDVSIDDSVARADQRCEATLSSSLRNSVTGYSTCMLRSENINLKRGKVHYAMMPVWILSTKWKDKDFLFAMNGQTGKFVGDLPVSWTKFWILFTLIATLLSIITSIIAVITL